jgi:hypothetical protein
MLNFKLLVEDKHKHISEITSLMTVLKNKLFCVYVIQSWMIIINFPHLKSVKTEIVYVQFVRKVAVHLGNGT